MSNETTPMQEMVDGQLAELQITSAEVTGETYKERHAAKIAALAEEEAALPVPTDKASLQVVQDFITKSEKARTGIDKFRKAFKDRWKPMLDAVDAYLGTTKESGRQAEIYAIQQRAEAKKKAYLDEQAKAARAAEELLERQYQARVAKLLEAGMAVEPNGNLTIRDGDQTLSALPRDIRFATDEQMAAVLTKVGTIRAAQIEREAAALQAKEAEEREQVELAARLKAKEEEQKATEANLKADREALEKEREEMADTRAETRGADLVVLGAVCHGYGPALHYEIGDVIVAHAELRHMDAETWTATRDRVRDAKVKAIQEQKQRDREWELYAVREEQLINMGIRYDGENTWTLGEFAVKDSVLFKSTSDEWDAVLARFKEAAEAREQAAVDTAMAASSGISEGDPLVDETMDFLADKGRVNALSEAIQAEGSAEAGAPKSFEWPEGEDNELSVYTVDFEGVWPVGNGLVILAHDEEEANDIARNTIKHSTQFTVKRHAYHAGVVLYLSGDY
jgi:flagellar hook protein FlgE